MAIQFVSPLKYFQAEGRGAAQPRAGQTDAEIAAELDALIGQITAEKMGAEGKQIVEAKRALLPKLEYELPIELLSAFFNLPEEKQTPQELAKLIVNRLAFSAKAEFMENKTVGRFSDDEINRIFFGFVRIQNPNITVYLAVDPLNNEDHPCAGTKMEGARAKFASWKSNVVYCVDDELFAKEVIVRTSLGRLLASDMQFLENTRRETTIQYAALFSTERKTQ
ncbi:MAG: hypothetical protein WC890_03450 [Candidatus Margulisiibacteriota bacterium]